VSLRGKKRLTTKALKRIHEGNELLKVNRVLSFFGKFHLSFFTELAAYYISYPNVMIHHNLPEN